MATIKVNSTSMRDKANSFKTVANSIKTFTGEMTADELIRMCASNAVLKNGIAADSIAKTGSRILLL